MDEAAYMVELIQALRILVFLVVFAVLLSVLLSRNWLHLRLPVVDVVYTLDISGQSALRRHCETQPKKDILDKIVAKSFAGTSFEPGDTVKYWHGLRQRLFDRNRVLGTVKALTRVR